MRQKIIGLGVALLVAGCAGNSVHQQAVHTGSRLVTTDAATRIGYVHHKGDRTLFCFQPEPDADDSKEGGFSFGLSIINTGDGGGGSDHASVENEMSGRSPGVLFAREAFYRLCEMAVSTEASPDKWESLYIQTLDRVTEVLKIEASAGKTDGAHGTSQALPTLDLPQGQRPQS